MTAPFVRLEIEGLEAYIASLCTNYVTKDELESVVNAAVEAAIASLDITPAPQPQPTWQEVTGDTPVDINSAVVYSNLENETDIAVVALPVISDNIQRVTFLARHGGMNIIPNGYGLPTRNTIDGCFGITIGVGEYASAVGEGETATFITKRVARKFESVDLVNDGVDTWYIV